LAVPWVPAADTHRRQLGQDHGDKKDEAKTAAKKAEENPPRRGCEKVQYRDLNKDGFVTLDEVVAMEKAGLKDRDIVDRSRRPSSTSS
jgi:hypothetical protein